MGRMGLSIYYSQLPGPLTHIEECYAGPDAWRRQLRGAASKGMQEGGVGRACRKEWDEEIKDMLPR